MQLSIEEEYERFIEFSTVLDRKTRKYLIEYLKFKLDPDAHTPPELNDQYFEYFKKALDNIFAIDSLLDLCKTHEKITQQIIKDTLFWLRKTYHKVKSKNPYEDETRRLNGWTVTPMKMVVTRWRMMLDFLHNEYTKEEIDTGFYRNKFNQLFENLMYEEIPEEKLEEADLILTDLLAQWDALLNAKILKYQLSKLEEEQENYTDFLEGKVQEYLKLSKIVAPFAEYVGRYWDMSRELWKSTSFDVIQQYDDLLRNEKSIQELADMLGKMREAEIEIEEEAFEKTIIRQEWVTDEWARSEVVGIHESDDLSSLLSSEASLLADGVTETLFLKKYADKNLLTFKYEDKQLVRSEDKFTEINQRVKQREKGPFIICVDTSESMNGKPEQIAKVLCLAILKMAAKDNRRAYLINFSTGIETIDLYNLAQSIDEVAKFLNMSFYGGTDISLPLYEAIRQLKGENYKDADVLVISDFIMYKVDEDILQEVKYFQQNQGTQFHSLTLSDEPNHRILAQFDTNWQYDPTEKGIFKALATELQNIRTRI